MIPLTFRDTYIVNNYLGNLIFLNAFIFRQYEFIYQYIIISSVSIFIFSIFSGNQKNELLRNYNLINFANSLFNRILIIFIFLIFSLFSLFFLKELNPVFVVFVILLHGLIWIFDLILVALDINNENRKIKFFIIFVLIFALIFNFLYINEIIISFTSLIYIYVLFYLFITFFYLKNFKILNFLFFQNIQINKFLGLNFISSYSINFLNLILRLVILFSFTNEISSELIFGLTILSLPQTLIANAIGPSYIHSKKDLPFYMTILISFYIFASIYLLFICNFSFVIDNNITNINNIFFVCAISGVVLASSQYIRQVKLFQSDTISIYKRDIFLSIILLVILMIIFFININFILYFYLIFSVTSLIFYLKRSQNLL